MRDDEVLGVSVRDGVGADEAVMLLVGVPLELPVSVAEEDPEEVTEAEAPSLKEEVGVAVEVGVTLLDGLTEGV